MKVGSLDGEIVSDNKYRMQLTMCTWLDICLVSACLSSTSSYAAFGGLHGQALDIYRVQYTSFVALYILILSCHVYGHEETYGNKHSLSDHGAHMFCTAAVLESSVTLAKFF